MNCKCGKIAERNGRCASCNRLERKAASIRMPDDPKPLSKVSDNMSKLLAKYGPLKKNFIHGRWCGVHGKPCIPTDIHHTRGRGTGFEDSWAEDHNVPRLLDTRYWLPVCREIHQKITDDSKWAEENGYSESRLSKK